MGDLRNTVPLHQSPANIIRNNLEDKSNNWFKPMTLNEKQL